MRRARSVRAACVESIVSGFEWRSPFDASVHAACERGPHERILREFRFCDLAA